MGVLFAVLALVYACVSVSVAVWMFTKGDVDEKLGMARKALLFAILVVAWPVLLVMLKCMVIEFRSCKEKEIDELNL
jgi:heme/copper-type cytochrome/quinol oxidase subunit 2